MASEVERITQEAGLNMLVNNAGTSWKQRSLADQTKDGLMAHFEVNSVVPLLMTQVPNALYMLLFAHRFLFHFAA